jgi:hypothetical protein
MSLTIDSIGIYGAPVFDSPDPYLREAPDCACRASRVTAHDSTVLCGAIREVVARAAEMSGRVAGRAHLSKNPRPVSHLQAYIA